MVRILYEDTSLIVAEKPAGVESQAAGTFSRDMVSELRNYLVRKNGKREPYIGVVHRLDKPVAGVMVYALTKEAAAALSRQVQAMNEQGMEKRYYALVCGMPQQEKGRLEDWLVFDRKTNMSRVVEASAHRQTGKTDAGRRAVLEYETAAPDAFSGFAQNRARLLGAESGSYAGALTLLRVHLLTGRHHQIRVQLSHAGLPILGDTKYNPYMRDYRGPCALCLCAYELCFTHPATGERMRFRL